MSQFNLKSLGHRTSLLFNLASGTVEEHDNYLLIKTASRPDFYWGNYLLFRNPPERGDFEKWMSIYHSHFDVAQQGFIAITWDSSDEGRGTEEFQNWGFDLNCNKVLTSNEVSLSWKKPIDNLEIKKYAVDELLDEYVDVHFDPQWKYGDEDSQRSFIKDSIKDFSEFLPNVANKVERYGAFVRGRLAADLGVFLNDGLCRFNNVATHSDFRRQGLCTQLVYEVSRRILETPGMTLVMEADANYHAAKIYESVGFKPQEIIYFLEWVSPKK